MRTRSKIGIGCLAIVLLIVGAGAWFWFTREPRPIVVAEPGDGGERMMLGEAPANFYPAGGPGAGGDASPAILLLGGSEGGLKETRNALARQLAAQGYAVLYPGYYMTREDNRAFELVPLETLDAALAWLAAREGVDPARIAVVGHSKGAEGALLVASRHPEVAAVVAAMPSDVVWQGFDFAGMDQSAMDSSWSAGGEPLPYVPYILPAWHEWITGGMGTLGKMYRTSWDARGQYPEAAIPVERIEAPILLICGEQDSLWPGCAMARAAQDRASEAELLAYDDAGHWAFGPLEGLHESDRAYLGQMGGTAEGDMAARRDQWPKILAFLDRALAPE